MCVCMREAKGAMAVSFIDSNCEGTHSRGNRENNSRQRISPGLFFWLVLFPNVPAYAACDASGITSAAYFENST